VGPVSLKLGTKLFYNRVVNKIPQIGASAPSFIETGDQMRSEDENSLQEKDGPNELVA